MKKSKTWHSHTACILTQAISRKHVCLAPTADCTNCCTLLAFLAPSTGVIHRWGIKNTPLHHPHSLGLAPAPRCPLETCCRAPTSGPRISEKYRSAAKPRSPWLKPLRWLVFALGNRIRNQGFLGGAKWISSIHIALSMIKKKQGVDI